MVTPFMLQKYLLTSSKDSKVSQLKPTRQLVYFWRFGIMRSVHLGPY